MTETFMLRALLFAGECFAASLLLLGLACVATRFLKHASLRHLVWLTAFGTILILPVAALVVPPQIAIHRAAVAEQLAPAPALSDFESVASVPIAPPAAAPSWNISTRDVTLALFTLWLLGMGWNALRLLIGAIGVNALQMSSARIGKGDLAEFVNPQRCDLRLASERTGPMTWGTLRPVILLPNGALSWPPHRLRAVLLHELAHVRRHDSFAQTLSRIVCALYWPNPLVWFGLRALRRDAEIAADDAVIDAGVRPSAYAGELLELAGEYRGASPAFAGLSMASESALAARVKSILSPDQFRRGATPMDVVKIAGIGLIAAAALAMVRPSLADDAPPVRAVPSIVAVPPVPPLPPVILAENDVPAAPPAPAAPETPPAPPAVGAPPAPPEPPLHHRHHHMHLHSAMQQAMREMHVAMHEMRPEERRKVHEILRNAHQEMQQAMLKARPEMERAMAEMRAHRDEMKNLRPQIREAMLKARPDIERAMRKAHDALEKAHVDERVRRHVDEAMRSVQMHMDERRAMEDAERDHGSHEMDLQNSEQDEGQEDNNN